MEAYTTAAGILCLVAINAMKKRAIAAGVDPADSSVAQKTAYVPVWIWNHATKRAKALPGRTKTVGTSIAVSQQADLWASGVHRYYFHLPSSRSSTLQSGCSGSRCVDKPGKRACYSGSIKGRNNDHDKERLQSLSHHNATNDSVCL